LSGYTIQPDTTIEPAPTTTAPKTHATKDTSSKKAPHVKHGTSASVWVLSGKTLIQKKITTGMNDDTNVEILSGLTANDDVVTGIESTASAKKGASTAVRSPFMPQMGRPAAKPAPAK
jgi:HlyD family secretion protein